MTDHFRIANPELRWFFERKLGVSQIPASAVVGGNKVQVSVGNVAVFIGVEREETACEMWRRSRRLGIQAVNKLIQEMIAETGNASESEREGIEEQISVLKRYRDQEQKLLWSYNDENGPFAEKTR